MPSTHVSSLHEAVRLQNRAAKLLPLQPEAAIHICPGHLQLLLKGLHFLNQLLHLRCRHKPVGLHTSFRAPRLFGLAASRTLALDLRHQMGASGTRPLPTAPAPPACWQHWGPHVWPSHAGASQPCGAAALPPATLHHTALASWVGCEARRGKCASIGWLGSVKGTPTDIA